MTKTEKLKKAINWTGRTTWKIAQKTAKAIDNYLEEDKPKAYCHRCGKPINPKYQLCWECHQRQKRMPKQ